MICCRLLTFFSKLNFQKDLSGTLSECQTVWIQIRTDVYQDRRSVGPDMGPNCFQMLSSDETVAASKEMVNQSRADPDGDRVFGPAP